MGTGETLELIDCFQNVGIFTTSSQSFRIEENTFNGYTLQGPGTVIGETFGVITETSEGKCNDIYKNTFSNLTYGALSIGKNTGTYNFDGSSIGLRYSCNTFSGNDNNDILINGSTFTEGIAGLQGLGSPGNPIASARNSFQSGMTNLNNLAHPIHYVWATNIPATQPSINSSAAVNLLDVNDDNLCPSRLPSSGTIKLTTEAIGDLYNSIQTYGADLPDLIDEYQTSLDNGSTESLLEEIYLLNYDQSAYDILFTTSPFLSEEVLRFLIDNEIYSLELLEALLIENPDVLRSQDFIEYLMEEGLYTNPVQDALNNVSERTELVAKITWYQVSIDQAYDFLITDVKNDTLATNADSMIIALLGEQQTLLSSYHLVGHYYSTGRLDQADSMMSQIPVLFNLTDHEDGIHQIYDTLLGMLRPIKASNGLTTALGGEQKLYLEDIVANSVKTSAKHAAEATAEELGPLKIDCASYYLYEAKTVKHRQTNEIPRKTISVYPNPATDFVVFSYSIPRANNGLKVTIMNITGHRVADILLSGNAGVERWNTKEMIPGTYLYQLSDSKMKYSTGKVVIIK